MIFSAVANIVCRFLSKRAKINLTGSAGNDSLTITPHKPLITFLFSHFFVLVKFWWKMECYLRKSTIWLGKHKYESRWKLRDIFVSRELRDPPALLWISKQKFIEFPSQYRPYLREVLKIEEDAGDTRARRLSWNRFCCDIEFQPFRSVIFPYW